MRVMGKTVVPASGIDCHSLLDGSVQDWSHKRESENFMGNVPGIRSIALRFIYKVHDLI
jgi:hypothetical protein